MSEILPNRSPVWLAGVTGPAHRAGVSAVRGALPKETVCRKLLAGMIRTTLIGAHVNGVPFCPSCFPESARMPGWPMGRAWRA